jgi:AraC-like DNA-binding protein
MGVAPHQWLIRRRVEAAREALEDPRLSLAEVALRCGFADQSHLTRLFSRIVGIGPGAWRRHRGIGASAVGRRLVGSRELRSIDDGIVQSGGPSVS